MKNRIPVVDDDELILFALAKILKDSAIEVITASTRIEAIKKLSYCTYKLCLIDIHLPDMSGLVLMNIVREMCPEAKIIIMTGGHSDFSELNGKYIESFLSQVSRFITKPFHCCDVRETVEKILRGEDNSDRRNISIGRGTVEKSRKHPREPYGEKVCFQMSIIDNGSISRKFLEAQAVDISDSGIGLLSSYPLNESQIIGFDEKNKNKTGVVTWSRMIDGDICRAGVKFA
jgi:DNA-binding NtrC family response regulator